MTHENKQAEPRSPHHVVVVGGGFGGLYAARELGRTKNVTITLVDKRNFHLFQPLLYQVATGSLSPGDISSPLRTILSRNRNTKVLMDEVVDIDPEQRRVVMQQHELTYDSLIIATGVSHHYFGNDTWGEVAPGLKTVEDALSIRRRIFLAFEAAEKEPDPDKRRALLTFVIVGGGPTGVELAGALAELAHHKLVQEFRDINTRETQILLLEGMDRVLPPYPAELSAKAETALKDLGVTVRTGALVTNILDHAVVVRQGDRVEQIAASTILWAAGVKASSMGQVLATKTGVALDRVGRVRVNPDLSVAGYNNIFVVGDLAHYAHQDDQPLPAVAPVAMQQGSFVAKLIQHRLQGSPLPSFRYTDSGSLAVIGRNAAVVRLGKLQFTGFPAWIVWIFVHIYYLIEFDNKLLVMTQWFWTYFTRKGGARLITWEDAELDAVLAAPEERDRASTETSPVKI